mmetsp:Transcript_23009/g.64334  ORF Transcript_23009/g.64334 Transcript_23009/m.64334 type:complete len:226 (+) Transcript_23009:1730-2407(+)
MQRHDQQLSTKLARRVLEPLPHLLDVVPARQEHQHGVSVMFRRKILHDVPHEAAREANHLGGGALLLWRSAGQTRYPQHVLEEVLFYREHVALHSESWAPAEVPPELFHLNRGGHQDKLQRRVPSKDHVKNGKEEVSFERPFVNFIENDVRKVHCARTAQASKKQPRGDEEDLVPALRRRAVETHLISHRLAELLSALPGHTPRRADGTDAPRLGDGDPYGATGL